VERENIQLKGAQGDTSSLRALIEQSRLENSQLKITKSNLESEIFGRDRQIQ
jgi:hypothetical protein